MTMLQEGSPAPAIDLPTDSGGQFSLADMKGEKILVFFYPKDDTSGCTKQACSLNDNLKHLERLGLAVVGISKDSVKSHDKFKAKFGLQFPLASDQESDVCERYGVWVEKSMYGRKYMGIERSSFLIDEKGIVRKIWRKVNVDEHTQNVMDAVQEISKAA